MAAKYYIYRNLHTKTFSVRYKGKVIAHPRLFTAYNVTFKVNQIGRQKVLNERRKNVHAFAVCDSWKEEVSRKKLMKRVLYNPYNNSSFVDKKSNPIVSTDIAIGVFGHMIFIGKEC